MPEPVRVKVDLASGLIEIEADAESVERLFDKLQAFLPSLSQAYQSEGADGEAGAAHQDNTDVGAAKPAAQQPESKTRHRTKETYTLVDLGLTPEQRAAMREFYQLKQPKNQNEQTAVVMDWLRREGGKPQANLNEIFSGFRTVDEKAPGKISSVLGNMTGLGWLRSVGAGKFELTHVGEDHVKFKLPKKK